MTKQKNSIFDQFPDYEATIGIEVHVQLKTNSKIFCSCPNHFGDKPNTNICEICAGHPGTLPVLNKKVVDFAIMAGLATNCIIRDQSDFARKHYFYPDLPKNYQITQDKKPICQNGYLPIQLEDGTEKNIRITRIHMEEDAGKNIHASNNESLVDLNRAGTPLLEIVTEPDISSSEEARAYLTRLHTLVRYLGVSDANMEEGSFRGDINISIKKKNIEKLGTRVELKNINSFKFIVQAIEYEIERHINLLESGEKIKQETRLWDSKNHKTYFMREKSDAQDYRYFTDPDLPQIDITNEWMDTIKQQLPELPYIKAKRFQDTLNLSAYEADLLTEDKALSEFFEEAVSISNEPKIVCNWIVRDLLAYLKEQKLELNQIKITPAHIAELATALSSGKINSKAAQDIFADMAASGAMPTTIIKEKGLEQIDSTDELKAIVQELIDNNPDNVAKFKAGKDRVLGFFVGQAMKATKGKGNPKILTDLFKELMNN